MGREFEIERLVGDVADIVTFNFDKYHRPRFQVHAARRALAPPHEFVRSCNLVAKKSQYVYFWGAPALLPSAWWSNALSDRTVERMSNRIHQVIDFLESGERGQNVSQAL